MNISSTPPPSPSPPRFLPTPLPSTPSPRPGSPLSRENQILSHFTSKWIVDERTGLMTLDTGNSYSTSNGQNSLSDDSDNEDETEVTNEVASRNKKGDKPHNWRNKERMKTLGVAIALCLNLGTDPPDRVRVSPCARTECGIDPTRYLADAPAYSLLKMIGTQLEEQFQNLQPRAKIKLAADPTVEMIRKTCTSLRRIAKTERVLVHINGHGVPRPTRNGEVWAFNDDFTQYIPLSVFDLIRWTGHPAMFTFDCQSAGQLITHFLEHERDNERKYRTQLEEWRKNRAKRRREQERKDRRERENEKLVRLARGQILAAQQVNGLEQQQSKQQQDGGDDSQPSTNEEEQRPVKKKFIVLVPCGADEDLPSSPLYPADLFTCCLTIPIQTALKWFILQNRLTMEPLGIEQGMVNLVPGKANERRSMLGELNWIFTAVTDTIAWSVLPRKLFQRLFRQDLLVASMLRHFLLAERIFRSLGCTPQSIPALPSTWKHRMWDAWDQAVERCLIQLPSLVPVKVLQEGGFHRAAKIAEARQKTSGIPRPISDPSESLEVSEESRFFKDQLQAFEMWLSLPPSTTNLKQAPPEQLPVVLQVLLSHQHRFIALDQLARFLDLGPWAVSHALSVGIFPYVLKLLQSPVPSLKVFLVRIWVRILDLDPTCCDDLNQAKEQGYFIKQLMSHEDPDHAARAALVLALSSDGDEKSKLKCLSHDMDRACMAHLIRRDTFLENGASSPTIPSPDDPSSTSRRESTDDSGSELSDSENSDDRPRIIANPQSSSSIPTAFADIIPSFTTNSNLIRWSCLALAKLWDRSEIARSHAMNMEIPRCLEHLLNQKESPEVREAAAYALGMLFGPIYIEGGEGIEEHEKVKSAQICDQDCDLAVRLLKYARQDGSPLVRREIIFAINRFVSDSAHLGSVQSTVLVLSEYRQRSAPPAIQNLKDRLLAMFGSRGPKYMSIWLDLTRFFAVDPFPAVAQTAQLVISFVKGGVDARIEAIRGRVDGDGSLVAVPNGISNGIITTTAPPPPPQQQQQHQAGRENELSSLIGSDLFIRAKKQMCKCRQDIDEEQFQMEVQLSIWNKRIQESFQAEKIWKQECFNWIGHSTKCYEWYHLELEDEDDDYPLKLKNLKAPFLQLIKAQHEMSETQPRTQESSNTSLGDTTAHTGENELIRRFDHLPVDLFSSLNIAPLRRSSSYQSLPRQSTLSQMSLGASGRQLRSSTPNEMEEVFRMEFGKQNMISNGFISSFHPFSPSIVVAGQQTISSWDASTKSCVRFSNLNFAPSVISSMTWLDEKTEPLLLTYAEDAHIRVWKEPTTNHVSLATAFSPFGLSGSPSINPEKRQSFVEWIPNGSQLVCTSSFSPFIRLWDLSHEKLVSEIGGSSTITSLTSSMGDDSNLFAASFIDGVTKVYDRRADGKTPLFSQTPSIYESVVAMSKISQTKILASATSSGEVRIWDFRMSTCINRMSFKLEGNNSGNSFFYAFHPNAPMFAVGQRKCSTVRIFTLDDIDLCQIKPKSSNVSASAFGFMAAQKVPRDIVSLAWHPHEIALSVGNLDFNAIYVAPNTLLRGVWSPQEMKMPAVIAASNATTGSQHSSSNVSLS